MTKAYTVAELKPKMSATLVKSFTMEDINRFADLSLDANPLHLDPAFAAKSIFKQPICHGFLVTSLISALIGTRLPGEGSIYLSQNLKFLAPVLPNQEVTAKVQVLEVLANRGWVRLATSCSVAQKDVVVGEALIMPPK